MAGSRSRFLLAPALLMAALLASSCLRVQTPEGALVPLPPFPADDPKAWVCKGPRLITYSKAENVPSMAITLCVDPDARRTASEAGSETRARIGASARGG
jgi:hypothetical protein